MANYNLTPDNSVETPMGTIYAEPIDDVDYPGIYVYLLRNDTLPLLLSVVECDTHPYKEENPRINVLSYYRLDQDEPCNEGYVYQENIDAWKEACKH